LAYILTLYHDTPEISTLFTNCIGQLLLIVLKVIQCHMWMYQQRQSKL